MLKISKLNAEYGNLHVLHDVSLQVKSKSICVLMGPNGAGKSTLLKSIYGLAGVSSGDITYNGTRLNLLKTHEFLELSIAYVPQGKINFDSLTVEENLLIGAQHLKDRVLIRKRLRKIYQEFLVLEEKRSELAFRLSGGQQQMLAIGRTMMNQPEMVLMDEPSLGLSPRLIKQVFGTISRLNRVFGTTFLVVEHNIRSMLDVADYGFIMSEGRIIAEGNVSQLKDTEALHKVFMGKLE